MEGERAFEAWASGRGFDLSENWAVDGNNFESPDTRMAYEIWQAARAQLGAVPTPSDSFDWAPIERICAASGLDVAVLREGPEDNVSGLIAQWYIVHRAAGGEPDPVQEDLIAEVRAEDAAGQPYSHEPGRA